MLSERLVVGVVVACIRIFEAWAEDTIYNFEGIKAVGKNPNVTSLALQVRAIGLLLTPDRL